MAKSIATVSGYALRPGVSRNNRRYTRETIAKAVERAQKRLADGGPPMTMLTHHAAEDDSSRIVGRVTSVSLAEDGSARFTADIADTSHGRDIAALADSSNGEPFLSGVSIRGAWAGRVRRETTEDGQAVETADDLEIDGLDWTKNPGVPGAVVDRIERSPTESAPRVLIFESVQEARVEAITKTTDDGQVEEKGAAPLKSGKPAAAPTKAPAGSYADPGYQGDKAPRYPLDTKAHAKSAWAYINQAKNARNYSAKQLKRIKGRIKAALRKFGVEITDESWLLSRDTVTEVAEGYGADRPASMSVCLDNGMVCVTVSSYCVDPHDLDLIGRAAMDGACAALERVDPDMDGDMDVPGASGEDTDHDMGERSSKRDDGMESAPHQSERVEETDDEPPADAPSGDDQPAPEPEAEPTQEEEHAVSEPTTPAAAPEPAAPDTPAAVGGVTLSMEQFELLLSKLRAPEPATAGAPAETAPAQPEPVTEAEAPNAETVTETEDQRIARLVAEGIKAALPVAVQEHVINNGPPARKGLVGNVSEARGTAPGTLITAADVAGDENWPRNSAGDPLQLHEIPRDQFPDTVGQYLETHVLKDRANR